MLSKKEVLLLNSELVNESFSKFGDLYRGQVIVDLPKSLVNAVRSKAKKELGVDTVESYSDITICDLILDYIKTTYLNIESIPVSKLFGIESNGEPGDATTNPVDDLPAQPVQPVQPTMDEIESDVQPVQSVQPDVQPDVQF